MILRKNRTLQRLYPMVIGLCFVSLGCPSPSANKKESSGTTKGTEANTSSDKASSTTSNLNPSTNLSFVDRLQGSGIDHQYNDGRSADVYSIVESAGGGLAVCDFDRDGSLDLLYPGGGSFDVPGRRAFGFHGAIYRATEAWKFRSSREQAWVDMTSDYQHGIFVADYDNDGFEDFLVTCLNSLQLFHNQGDGTFIKQPTSCGLHGSYAAVGSAWGDVENDGDLDLLVVTYTDWTFDKDPKCISKQGVRDLCGPRDFTGSDDHFYLNQGDGTFVDATKEKGLLPKGRGLGALAADLDGDRKVEFFVANDEEVNFLYRTREDGTFEERGVKSGTALDDSGSPDGNMGIALGDYNRDGKFDLFITHYETETCGLYKNVGRLNFQHTSRLANITCMGNLFVAWGTSFVDFDLDGDEDIALINGHVLRKTGMAPLDQTGVVLENDRAKSFQNVSASAGDYFQIPRSARGLVTADFDGDGRVDLASSNVLQPQGLLQNESKSQGSWLRLRLVGTASNRNGIGTTATIEQEGMILARQIVGGGSYASTSDYAIHFGLGNWTNVERVTIRWPSGRDTVLTSPALNSEHLVVEE